MQRSPRTVVSLSGTSPLRIRILSCGECLGMGVFHSSDAKMVIQSRWNYCSYFSAKPGLSSSMTICCFLAEGQRVLSYSEAPWCLHVVSSIPNALPFLNSMLNILTIFRLGHCFSHLVICMILLSIFLQTLRIMINVVFHHDS